MLGSKLSPKKITLGAVILITPGSLVFLLAYLLYKKVRNER
jgi:hypothetical protein